MIDISTDKHQLQVEVIHEFLTSSYWAKNRTLEDVKKTIEYSFCFGVYINEDRCTGLDNFQRIRIFY